MTLAVLENLLRERVGLDPEVAGPFTLKRAVSRRLNAMGWPDDDLARYQRLAVSNPDELLALIEEVVVPESWFFRDELPFAYLRQVIVEGWIARPERPPLRVLSIPCSRGEETYSIAMTLDEAGLSPRRSLIDGFDISRNAIQRAEGGLYSENAFRSKNRDFRDRYFVKEDDAFRIIPKIRERARFHEGNLLDDRSITGIYDIIFCRNVLIYFDPKARGKAVQNLVNHLEPGGLLFVGHAEGLGILGNDFRGVGEPGTFAFAWNAGGTREKRPVEHRSIVEPARGLPSVVKQLEFSSIPIDPSPPRADHKPTPTDAKQPTLNDALALADQGRHAEAAAVCRSLIAREGPSASAIYLLGLVRQAEGERLEAERCFEKSVYLDPTHEEALLALARIAEGRGDVKSGENLRRRAARARRETAS